MELWMNWWRSSLKTTQIGANFWGGKETSGKINGLSDLICPLAFHLEILTMLNENHVFSTLFFFYFVFELTFGFSCHQSAFFFLSFLPTLFIVIIIMNFFCFTFFFLFYNFSSSNEIFICKCRLPYVKQDAQQYKILYIGLYLLIWGEAANLRFMPECLCYIFHHVSQIFHVYNYLWVTFGWFLYYMLKHIFNVLFSIKIFCFHHLRTHCDF